MITGPFWRYYGGKWRDAPHYPEPARGLIIEPFAGAAGYSLRYADRDVLLVDQSPIIAGIWRYLIDVPASDVLALPDIPEGGTVDDMDAPQAAKWLAGLWCNTATVAPCRRPSKWAAFGEGAKNWGGWNRRSRQRIASQVGTIRHWRVIHGSYDAAPDIDATWFVDPPYQGRAGRHYPEQPADFDALGEWCRARRGQAIVCEQDGATWLPFEPHRRTRSTHKADGEKRSPEVAWFNPPLSQGSLWSRA